MTKAQKIWLSIFLALVVVPEVLWSPFFNVIYPFFFVPAKYGIYPEFRRNFLFERGNENLWAFILGVQFLGILGITVLLFFTRKKTNNKIWFWSKFALLSLVTFFFFFVFYFKLTFRPSLVW